jgi:hypothetical protein
VNCTTIANGIIAACKETQLSMPLIVSLKVWVSKAIYLCRKEGDVYDRPCVFLNTLKGPAVLLIGTSTMLIILFYNVGP